MAGKKRPTPCEQRSSRFRVSAHRGEARIRYTYSEGNMPNTGCGLCDLEQSGMFRQGQQDRKKESSD